MSKASRQFQQVLGIRFFTGYSEEAAKIGLKGGLVVVPAAPALVEMPRDPAYCEALLQSDLALTDSGFMVLIWNLLNREKITRISGLEYLKLILATPAFKEPHQSFWIMPTRVSLETNLHWFRSRRLAIDESDCYVAPMYESDDVKDLQLLEILRARKPSQIVIGLGGGIQEKLGHYLKCKLGYKPGLHCIGAAIAFLSGDQVKIPPWADHMFLGWLLRCLHEPKKFLPRYWRARKLLPLLIRYRDQLPRLPQ